MEDGIRRLEQGSKAHPSSYELRAYYLRYRDLYVDQLLFEGDKARVIGRNEPALAAYERVMQFSPDNPRARAGIDAVRADQRQRDAVKQAQEIGIRDAQLYVRSALIYEALGDHENGEILVLQRQ